MSLGATDDKPMTSGLFGPLDLAENYADQHFRAGQIVSEGGLEPPRPFGH